MDELPPFIVVADPQHVEAWSVRRLPFEPRGAMLEFRAALRAGLALLDASTGRLRCVYSSPLTDLCDAENVLLYNVGMASFVQLADRSITFERAHVVPEPPTQLSGPALHHHRYAVDAPGRFAYWRTDGVLAAWKSPLPERVDKAAGWWWQTRSALSTESTRGRAEQTFGLRIQLGGMRRSTASVIKPMLDGIIAAFHADDAPTPEAVKRLSLQLGRPEPDIRDALALGPAALGRRALVRPFREGLQWNPADDLCAACTIEHAGPSGAPVIRGQLLAVLAVRP